MVRHQIVPLPYHPDRYRGYRMLWVRVIVRAAYDYALGKNSTQFAQRKFAMDAARWLFEPSGSMNGFDSICELFSLPPEAIRKWAKGLDREDVKKLEFRERNGRDPMDLILTTGDSVEKAGEDGDDR